MLSVSREKHDRAETLHSFIRCLRKMTPHIVFWRVWGGRNHKNEHPQSTRTSDVGKPFLLRATDATAEETRDHLHRKAI